jgi:2-polyprenyl-6-hydroxyphenyl methylase/3-demethylubiquinone-9 3-methyltransferase
VLRLLAPKPHEQWLEIGCGRGFLTRDLSERGVQIEGTDANPHAIENAVTDRVRQMSADALDFPPDSFDAVIAVHVIEHMADLAAVLAEISRVLKPGGKALFIYPAEPVQGLYAMPSAFTLLGNPFKARKVHCQWLWPAKMRKLSGFYGLEQVHSEFQLFATPQFVSVFQKV